MAMLTAQYSHRIGCWTNSDILASDIQSAVGIVTTAIPEGGAGEVILEVSGSQMNKRATADDGGAIARGAHVRVVRYLGSSVVVELESDARKEQ